MLSEDSYGSAIVSTNGIRVRYSYATPVICEPSVGDVVSFGRELHMSEAGFGDVKAMIAAYRLVCSNGATLPSLFGIVRRSMNPKTQRSKSIDTFMEGFDSLIPDTRVLDLIFSKMLSEEVFDDDYVSFADNVNKVFPTKLYGDFSGTDPESTELKRFGYGLMGIDDTIDTVKKEVQARNRMAKQDLFGEAPERKKIDSVSYYDLYNKITELPHSFPTDFNRRMKVEEIGGKLLAHVLSTLSNN